MAHSFYRVVSFEIVGPHKLRIAFDDGAVKVIDFRPVLKGVLYGPLLDTEMFSQVEVDPEAHTLVWPNGADFDPETLHDWPKYAKALKRMARRWAKTNAKVA